ncbi:MAG: ArsR/SmtB family transcription factor [Promethearchaeota archaeon]
MSQNDQETELKGMIDTLEAYSHEVRSRMMLLLEIYGELSLSELTEKLNKSKPTISRHAKILKDLGFIKFEEGGTHGNITQHKYSLNHNKLKSIDGQTLQKIEDTQEFYEATLKKISSFTAFYENLRWISEAASSYLEKMAKEVQKNATDRLMMNLINLDNLGEISYFYLTKKQLKALLDLQERFDKEFLEIYRQSDDSEPKPYLFQRIIMPIEHLIQASQKKEWETNGILWLFFEEDEDRKKIQSVLQMVPPDWPGRHHVIRLLKAMEENQKNDK